MQRYFVEPHQISGHCVTITGDDVHHIVKVMRSRTGQEIVVSDGQSRTVRARLSQLDAGSNQVQAEIVEWLDEQRELPIDVTIAQGLPKGDKWEWILQKGTELGASAFFPFSSERAVAKLDEKKEPKKRERWQKIVKEAAEQSHRTRLPAVMPARSFQQTIEEIPRYTACAIAYEQASGFGLHDVLGSLRPGDSLLVLIGPEGGFSAEEAAQATAAGAVAVSLGPRILRTETASQYVLAAVSYHFEQINGERRESNG
ncbi:16S rRNA (uracil(1498)-N(3))-methyltransferase [Brevibacillus sp. B_LB10_24]|uniref:16S rRNA (uracil(1498)-N(3))-methyltransferase n=1 Tax=Brevibacillus sp. B_LB10_24 TaxID=3380645 RepID=UPI0038B809F5